jgi:hypothetical protein
MKDSLEIINEYLENEEQDEKDLKANEGKRWTNEEMKIET